MPRLILLNKPFQTLSQFTDPQQRATLADFVDNPSMRVAGRLDYDSEGLLLLADDGALVQQIANPRHKMWKIYWVQVEGEPDPAALQRLQAGLQLNDGITLPARAKRMPQPTSLWQRHPPIRTRANQPVSWLEIAIREGRNRQVRRMTAAIGHPALRLVRVRVGEWSLQDLLPGQSRVVQVNMPRPRPVARRKPPL